MITIFALNIIYTTLICFVYFSKKKLKNTDNKIYKVILITTLLIAIIDIIQYLLMKSNILMDEVIVINKFYMICLSVWIVTFSNYVLTKSDLKTNNIVKKILKIIFYFFVVSILFLDVNVHNTNNMIYTSGLCFEATCIFIVINIIVMIASSLLNLIANKTKNKKVYIPLLIFVALGTITTIVQAINPGLLLTSSTLSFISILMYFFIENPDVKMLEEVSIAKEQAEKANVAKSEFLSNMSHEIRTPLNAIVGFSESLKEDNIPEESKEKVNDIITASGNLLEIVNGILDISKIEANKLEIINKEYEPKEIFKELVSLTKARIGDKGLDFQVNIDETIPSVLYGDATRVKQIILNILTNAVKYTKEGYVIFTVSSIIKDNVCRLIISVEDSGIGIKQESVTKLFSKFERLDVEKQLTIEGTGLGLAITKKLLDLMNGTIIVQSIYGKGSKFTISLDQRIISFEEPLENKQPEVESQIIDANGAKLLIVDDNEMNIKVAMTLLKKYHFDIDYCFSGLACLAKIKDNQKYDIIFLDDMMPQMTGRDTLKKLKENQTFKTPVIVLTANAITGMKEEYLSSGFNDYLSKPIEKHELERIIKKFIMNENKENINTETSMATTSLLDRVYKEVPTSKPSEVLVIDSNVYTGKILEEILESFNATITSVTTSKEAITKVIEKKYDLVLLDETLEDKKYEKVIDDLKSISGFETPVVLMTKNADNEELKENIKKLGFAGYISKPINNIEVETTYASITKNN